MNNYKFLLSIFIALALTFSALAKNATNKLSTVTVTANPLGHSDDDLIQPVTKLSGDELLYKMQPTIGETLAQEVGIRSTYFGPNASRPVIRGFEGDQIHIMQNGIGNLDASAASVDHNLAIDPLSVERIEVIRGPSALLYGSKAIGGVVNIIDNRIPDQPIAEKITGAVDSRFNSANDERSNSIMLEGGLENYAWHLNGFKRTTDNVQISGFARSKDLRASTPLDDGASEQKDKLTNSQSNTDGNSIGLSRFFKKGYFGASLTNYNSNYGTVSDPNVTIEMKQQRADFAGSYKEPISNIKEVKYKLGLSDYEHTEFEGSAIGTVFKNRGYDSRVELVHNKLGLFEGAFGFQSTASDFAASGDEAFLPGSDTKNNAGFILEEIHFNKFRLQMGGRLDYQTIDTKDSVNFGSSQSRNDLMGSGSVGVVYNPIKNYAIALSTSYTERAPNAQELYSNGEHVATGSFETGNKDLAKQQSRSVDLSFRKESGFLSGEVNFFYNKSYNFITSAATGLNNDEDLPIYNYVNLDAQSYGSEIKVKINAYDANSHKLAFEFRGDYVKSRDSQGNYLPRISAPRVGGGTMYNYQKIGLRLDADYTFSQNNVARFETKTDGFVMLNAGFDYKTDIDFVSSILYLKATNLLNEEARNHTSFLKDQAPLAGRSIMIGVKGLF